MPVTNKQRLTVLGATGSIGVSTLDVAARHPERFEVFALTAHTRVAELAAQCRVHRPRFAVVGDVAAAANLREELRAAGLATEVLAGEAALAEVAAHAEVDSVMAAIVGAAGLKPTLAAVRAGKRVLLANKEALVMAGPLFIAEVNRETLCVVRQTEQVVLPERGAMLGNFGATAIDAGEAWVTDGEYPWPLPTETKPHPKGADGSVLLGRIYWE